jgi:hypothetical protein
VHREDQHRLAGKLALDVAEQVEAAAAGHGEIEDRHVPLQRARHLQRLVAVGRLSHYRGAWIGGKHLLESMTNDRVVVCDENSHVHLLSVLLGSLKAKSIGTCGGLR